jgi:serine O-acetyltransferase
MANRDFELGARLGEMVERIVASYDSLPATRHVDRTYLPNREETIELLQLILELLYPGFLGRQHLNKHNVRFHVGDLLPRIGEVAYHQINNCLCYSAESQNPGSLAGRMLDDQAEAITLSFIEDIPHIREMLAADAQAAFDGDPAAMNTDEVVLAYPGLLAISVYRVANSFHVRGVPLMPRIMTEWAHNQTGIDIHPGATIGRSFFIDHGTGVVIGETTEIGNFVKIYQGVTLGALSFPKDDRGRVIRSAKRHPTVRDNVTIYANAIVLGGETVLGKGSVIGGSVFLTSSVPPDSVVTFNPPELRFRNRSGAGPDKPAPDAGALPDYAI